MKKDASKEEKAARAAQKAAHQAADCILVTLRKPDGRLGRARMMRRADFESMGAK
jgi:hypothetical protein